MDNQETWTKEQLIEEVRELRERARMAKQILEDGLETDEELEESDA